MKYELEIISLIQKQNKGKKPLNKIIKSKKIFDLERIELEEYIEPKTGNTSKKYSGIYYNEVYYKVNKPYVTLKEIILNKTIPVKGFLSKTKYGNKNTKNI